MPDFHYLYVNDHGDIFASADAPTPEDLAHATNGIVTITRLRDLYAYGHWGHWRPVEPGGCGSAESEVGSCPPFHAPVRYFNLPRAPR